MTKRQAWARGTGALVLAAAVSAASASDPGTGSGSAAVGPKALIREARQALEVGRAPRALAAYEAALGAGAIGARRREALYWATILRLTPDPAMEDAATGRKWLEELESSGASIERLRAARLVESLVAGIEAARRVAAESARAAEEREKESCEARAKALCDERLSAAQSEAQKARDEEAKCREHAAGIEAELKKKTEALERVREVLLGWTPNP